MLSHLIIRNPAVSNVCAMPMYWNIILSMALSWVQKFYSFYNYYVYVWVSEMMKTKFPELCNPKDSDTIMAVGESLSGCMPDETSLEFVNKSRPEIVHRWDLARLFSALDSNGDGLVTAEDVQGLMGKLGIQHMSDDHMKSVMGSLERMSFDDFCSLFLSLWEEGAEEEAETGDNVLLKELVEAFSVFDKNGDGFISPWELQLVLLSLGLKEGQDLGNCEIMISKFDRNSDGRIDLEEFENMMMKTDKSL